VKYILRIGTIFYGGNCAVRRAALERTGGFDTSIEFHAEDTNVGRRLHAVGKVSLVRDCYLFTLARRYVAMGKGAVFRLYVRNFTSELLRHRPRDTTPSTSGCGTRTSPASRRSATTPRTATTTCGG
jgi:GT2 family glycosyltransferase